VLLFAHALNALLMILMPIGLGIAIARRYRIRWGLFAAGAVTFAASQAGHVPLNAALGSLAAPALASVASPAWQAAANATLLALGAATCEEAARWIVLRTWIRDARGWQQGLMFGAGHGGIEAVALGSLAALGLVNMLAVRGVDPATLPLSAEERVLAARQIAEYWSLSPARAMTGALERGTALCLHASAALLVLQAFVRRNPAWLAVAIAWHATVDGAALFAHLLWHRVWLTEAIGVAFAAVSVAIVLRLRGRAPTL
jgi:uncharacterized membrane protein YhfC